MLVCVQRKDIMILFLLSKIQWPVNLCLLLPTYINLQEFYRPNKDAFLHNKPESLSFIYNKKMRTSLKKINMISRFSMQNSNRKCQ